METALAVTAADIAAAHRVLARAGYGARPGEAEALARDGVPAWVERQLGLRGDDPTTAARLAEYRLPLRIPGPDNTWVVEPRPLERLTASQDENHNFREPARVTLELQLATLLRKVWSEAQLFERLVEFWHDHFSVNGMAHPRIRSSMVEHDRRLRTHALGSFRALLEASSSSPAMLFYLTNASSVAGLPNENFARELLELHTLGRPAYFGAARTNREVPRDAAGQPLGYVDADVWEAARAFTGWGFAMGQGTELGLNLPRSGDFIYVEHWHDPYQKRFLGQELEPFGPALSDGRAVLDILARHPATARFVCGKLVRFLVGLAAPPAAVARGVAAFRQHDGAADQIAQVVRAILAGPEIADAALGRPRRPLDAHSAAARALAIPLSPMPVLVEQMGAAGQLLFGWPSPDGQPIEGFPYEGTGALRQRWSLLLELARNARNTGLSPIFAELAGAPVTAAATLLATRLLGPAGPGVGATIAAVWTGARRNPRPNAAEVAELAGWVLAAPAFQQC